MKFFLAILVVLITSTIAFHENYTQVGIVPVIRCIQFYVSAGTGCAWICTYCTNQLWDLHLLFP
uniref:Uncharacterized protein n=1 Tax=viral metagenome TaxID=1070528 RepID=A0A6C0KN67_9ZZZZ